MEEFESKTSQTWAYIREQSGKNALEICVTQAWTFSITYHTFHRDDLEDLKDQCVPQSLKTRQREE